MITIFLIAGLLVGALVGHKYGYGKGQDNSFIILEASNYDELKEQVTNLTKDELLLLDRHGFKVINIAEDE